MKRVLFLFLFGIGILFANTATLIDPPHSDNGWKANVVISPAVVVDKTIVSSDLNSSEADFKTDLDTTVYFLIDTSVPMKNSFEKGIRPLLSELERAKQPREKWIVSYFDTDMHVIYDDEKQQTDSIAKALTSVPVKGQRTELWRNTQEALKELVQRSSPRKILVLLSDGDAEDTSAYTREDVIKIANDAHIRIVSLSYRDTIGTQNMRKISEETNGAFWKADKVSQKLPSDFPREMIKFVRSQGIVTIPSSLIHSTKSGTEDLNITFEHQNENTVLSLSVETEKIVLPQLPKEPKKSVVKQPTKTEMQLFLEKYKLYLASAGVLLLIIILYFLLRKKPEPEPEPEETTLEQTTPNEPEPKTQIAPQEPLAYFESLDGTKHEVFKFPSTIGKSSTNDIVIPGQYISRQHATIIHKDGYFYIADNNSSNGIKVNGKKIHMQERITNGAKVSFGPYETLFKVVGISAAPVPDGSDERTRLNR